jgi:hypothetical protein
MQYTQLPPHFADGQGNIWHFSGGVAKPFRVYPKGENVFTSIRYKAATFEQAMAAFNDPQRTHTPASHD